MAVHHGARGTARRAGGERAAVIFRTAAIATCLGVAVVWVTIEPIAIDRTAPPDRASTIDKGAQAQVEAAEPHEGSASAGVVRQDEIATGVVTTASLAVRQTPDNRVHTMGALSNDSELRILAEQSDCRRVDFDDDDDCVEASQVERRTKGRVTASSLILRDAPNGGRIGALARNTEVSILATDGTWLEVDADGRTGWVSGDFIEEHVESLARNRTPSG